MLDGFETDFENVDAARRLLQQARLRAHLDLDNLETVFNAIEMATFLKTAGDSGWSEKLERARTSLPRLIAAILERTQSLPVSNRRDIFDGTSEDSKRGGGKRVGPTGYDDIARFARLLMHAKPTYKVSFITFNYDIGLEIALRQREVAWTYPANTAQSGIGQAVAIFKLHGSVNWWMDGEKLAIVDIPEIDRLIQRPCAWPREKGVRDELFMPMSQQMPWYKEASGRRGAPFIVPPAESKQTGRTSIMSTWVAASDAIAAADYLCVIGYSIPSTDEFFRQFFAMSLLQNARLRRMFVIDLAVSTGIGEKYRQLVGPLMESRLVPFSADVCTGVEYLYSWHRQRAGVL